MITIDGAGQPDAGRRLQRPVGAGDAESIKDFSAVGYFFGRELQDHIDVPIGLIDNSWGGSACDAWIPRDKFEGNPLHSSRCSSDGRRRKPNGTKPKRRPTMRRSWPTGRRRPTPPKRPASPCRPAGPNFNNPLTGNQRPANLYHARLGPVMPYAIRGVIWYQGESNAGRAYQYREMFPLMISSWREAWGQGDFPFYFVQLADFMAEKPEPGDSDWAELREAQTMTQDKLPNTGQAVIIDIGEAADIHPRNKLEVASGWRDGRSARTTGRKWSSQSPRYDSMETKGDKIILKFKDVDGGLRTVDNKNLEGFAIAGEDRKWVWADAKVLGKDQVEVHSDKVPNPVAVRYAWADNPVCNLYSWAGLPATPFRTDDWPGNTIDKR